MVVSVPRCMRCLSLSETIVITDAVGFPVETVALVVKPSLGFHSNVLPFFTVPIKTAP